MHREGEENKRERTKQFEQRQREGDGGSEERREVHRDI
jgi:hypothetical protein